MKTMKAMRIHSYGGEEVMIFENASIPVIADDEMLVKVHAAGVNPIDWKVREGYAKDFLHFAMPLVLGWDISGTVEKTGAAVSNFRQGDEVFAFIELPRGGGYAEYAVVKEQEAAFKPRSLDHVQSAAVPLAGLTAWQALFDKAHLKSGQRILIHAAAGGVGHFAVQLAHWRGAHAICTATEKNRDFLMEIGAHEVIDYNHTPFEEATEAIDVVLDTMAGYTRARSWKTLKPGGILVTTLPPSPDEEAQKHGVRAADILVSPNTKQLGEIAELIDSNHLKPFVQEVFPLNKAASALEISKAGHTRGKIVLDVV